MKVLELKGYKSFRALQARNALMLGLKMIPEYFSVKYEDFFATLDAMSEKDQRMVIKKAAGLVELSKEDIEALLSFVADPNNVPYDAANIGNLNPKDILEMVTEVCFLITQIKVDLVTNAEKKN